MMHQMSQPPIRPPDPLVADWLLSAVCRRLYFAAEAGVVAGMEYPPERFVEFVEAHFARPTRALAEVLRLAAVEADLRAAAKPLEGLALWTERLAAALRSIGQFRTLPREMLRDVADRFGAAWLSLRNCIQEVAAALGVEVSYLRDLPPAREHGVRQTLDVLADELQEGRAGSGL
jgi:hypothetical protein